ncbi:hypothetical protein BST95_11930 [Halioglobus japonicus]|uniref:Phosphohistidine phosphatase SixA n=1 Tax=Halioglobus japonicus TaxID=930805 RepID=A0AAP8MFK2_9GAMM|nr:hypothetical protein [Halioglobus japonicus]AQA18842.1 hypothetical protein BST95_11930 [Halioglobus japonicus]PLW86877.1 hypothetical protein C0029_10930 [Halioglobus japonicus]GHD23574.1 hypothetical protein GCM10007052_36440 [Halioglobus japonicus]
MYLTIMRHGEAGMAVTDRMRELTERGVADVGLGGTLLLLYCTQRQLPSPQVLLYSEWVRTAQTAMIVAEALPGSQLAAEQALIPGRQPDDIEPALAQRFGAELPEHVLLISHQPLVSRLVDAYLGVPGRLPGLVPGGFATLEMAYPGPDAATPVMCAQPPDYEVLM